MRGDDFSDGGPLSPGDTVEEEEKGSGTLPPPPPPAALSSLAFLRTFWSSSESGITRAVKDSSWDRHGKLGGSRKSSGNWNMRLVLERIPKKNE